jgi:ATP-dependent Clp protease ATP-binding subunit ClpA
MAGYGEAHHRDRLVGSPPGFVGFESGGELTEAVRQRPNQIVLFDEVEKAHPEVMTTLISVLEAGRLNDSRGQVAYFGEAILVFTSNLGSEQLWEHLATAPEDPSYETVEAIFRSAVERHFAQTLGRPEILGRIKPGITVFDMLRPSNIDAITLRMVDEVCLTRGPRLTIDPVAACATARDVLTSPKARSLGVREIRNVLTIRLRRVATWCAINQVGRDQELRVELWPDRTELSLDGGRAETLPI